MTMVQRYIGSLRWRFRKVWQTSCLLCAQSSQLEGHRAASSRRKEWSRFAQFLEARVRIHCTAIAERSYLVGAG